MQDNYPTPPTTEQRPPARPILLQAALLLALLIIGGLLLAWHPWQPNQTATDDRTVSVSGSAEISAEPDEYIFSPRYNFKNVDQKMALADATVKTNEVVTKLKSLGVADSKIKTDTSGYKAYYDESQGTYHASLTITINNKALAQKVQDYILTTAPIGSVTPRANFSQAKRDQLTSQARDQATKAARTKANQSARNLGFKVGKVKSVSDSPDRNFFGTYGLQNRTGSALAAEDSAAGATAPIQQGEDKLTYEVAVVYYLH